jgi:hypothetical protein
MHFRGGLDLANTKILEYQIPMCNHISSKKNRIRTRRPTGTLTTGKTNQKRGEMILKR